ncbi:MAG: glycogen synthase GlgA [Deltaproteobacteria bacterium]|nr:glycogen synthase GlgA [Deltaproteobacteria bacterium]MBW2053297.1 glycogen synthase GlgA [Deltaproteobacteria bacterium]MBW2141959.1 glycogen synthase GlgA [Deltaproteobacteria bacterium]MBW2323492.1 glycogen synthase GlgA [Deltaproteobacteria bacterium]
MDILLVTPEITPFARVGGLGDVSHHLSRALDERGHHLRVITPKYRYTEAAGYPLTRMSEEVTIPLAHQEKVAEFFSTQIGNGVEVYFVGCDALYDRAELYGNEFGDYEDNAERYIFFSRAVLEFVHRFDLSPEIIHCHDWQTGLIPVYVKTLYQDLKNLKNTATVFTFHNLGAQGVFMQYDFPITGLGWDFFTPEYIEFHGKFNFAKAGLIFADLISTVSQKYAQEVLTPEYGFGLEGVLRARQKEICAVLNGVDYLVWDPAVDKDIAENFSPDNLAPKAQCRQNLAQAYDLTADDAPLVAIISRLVDRKGFDLITAAVDRLMTLEMKLIVLGSGDDKYHVSLKDIAAAYPDRIAVKLMYDNSLAHKVMAGADIFLMPSRYEPCGLEQLYSLKYGTIPVVRSTGGLADTIIDCGEDPKNGNGFKFLNYTTEDLFEAMSRAVKLFRDRESWKKLMLRGMSYNFTWDTVAAEYENLYRRAQEKVSSNNVAQIK